MSENNYIDKTKFFYRINGKFKFYSEENAVLIGGFMFSIVL